MSTDETVLTADKGSVFVKKVFFVQVSVDFGNSYYLPYAAGTMIASCLANEAVSQHYSFPEIIFIREKLHTVLDRLTDAYMVAFSCNIWNIEYNKALAKLIKQRDPECMIVFGGHSVGNSTELLETEEAIDILLFGEGERVFPDLLFQLNGGDLRAVNSIAFRDGGKIVRTPEQGLCDLSAYPSPYAAGVFDEIVRKHPDVEFSAILETNRGCPYSCAFCDWTHGKRMRFFPMEKVQADLLWIAKNRVPFCYCIDSNFGMYERDLELIDYVVKVKREYGYPEVFRTNYEKNSTDRVFQICNTLNSVGMDRGATLSYQTLSPEALKNIGRKNLTLEHFSDLMRRYNEAGIATYSELILGFPGETYESFCKGICTLLEQGQHSSLFVYLCELLPNSQMADPDYMRKHQIRSIKAYFKNAHSKANVDDEVHEYSTLVRATKTMNEDDWVRSNLFSVCVQCFHSLAVLRFFAIYLYCEKIADYFTFYEKLCAYLLSSEGRLGKLWREFRRRYEDSLKGNWHYANELFGDITWTYEEGAYLEAVYDWEGAIAELKPFLLQFPIPRALFEDLLVYQEVIIRKPFDNDPSVRFSYDFPEYFERIADRGYAPLEQKETVLKICSNKKYNDWLTYAREVVWYGRRKEANIYHRKEYSVSFPGAEA